MNLFLDTASETEVVERIGTGLISGITTNPSLILKSTLDNNPFDVYHKLIKIPNLPDVSIEVVADTEEEFIDRGLNVHKEYGPTATVKLPCTMPGIKACKYLSNIGIKTNVTLVFSVSQAILAAIAGATYVSPFVGRLDDNSFDGLALIEQIASLYKLKSIKTKVLAASIRDVRSVGLAFQKGADICTIPAAVFDKLVNHVLTDQGLEKFNRDFVEACAIQRDAVNF
tara:strand:- start:2531 stop:3211 length:681 start_codon:yes stop_codon:yes gene_type:complete